MTLNGTTTIDEVERYTIGDTLQVAAIASFSGEETNRQYREWRREQEQSRARENSLREEHRKRIEDTSKRIKFD